MRKIVATEKAPAAIGPYAQANIVDGFIFTSGQVPIAPALVNWWKAASKNRQSSPLRISKQY